MVYAIIHRSVSFLPIDPKKTSIDRSKPQSPPTAPGPVCREDRRPEERILRTKNKEPADAALDTLWVFTEKLHHGSSWYRHGYTMMECVI